MSEIQKPEKVGSKKAPKVVKRKQEDNLVRDEIPNKVFASELEELKSFRYNIYLNLGNMVKNHPYKIISAEKVNTKFGDRVSLELEGSQRLNLPEKYNKLSDNVLTALNKGKYHLINYGQVGKAYSIDFTEFPISNEFQEQQQEQQQEQPKITENEQQPVQSEPDQQYSTETEANINYDEFSQPFDLSLPGFYNNII